MTARLVKSAQLPAAAAVLAPLELRDVEREREALLDAARRRLDDARGEADRVVRAAADEARGRVAEALQTAARRGFERGLAEGRERGRREAHDQALAEARREFAERAESAAGTLDELARQWPVRHRELFVEARLDVLTLAIALARRVVTRIVESDPPAAAAETMQRALEWIGHAHELVVRVHSRDLESLRLLMEGADHGFAETDKVHWVADDAVERGGVRLEAGPGAVDARIGVQLDRLADELLDGWRRRIGHMGDVK